MPQSTSNITENHSDIEHVISLLDASRKRLVDLDPLACLLERNPKLAPDNLNKAESFVDCLATGAMKRV